MKNIVLSLYDFTGEAVKPWAQMGYHCVCFDIQHGEVPLTVHHGAGSITFRRADLHDENVLADLVTEYRGRAAFLMAFPVCTDMAVSGAMHFKKKLEADPLTHVKAVRHAINCAHMGVALKVPYFIENPVSILATRWRKPEYSFNPYEYGGYLSEDEAEHPTWPEYIAPRDAYPKKTCLWTSKDFVMPTKAPVECPKGYSTQHKKLGGKSMKTKNIRSATPRGFAKAVCWANAQKLVDVAA